MENKYRSPKEIENPKLRRILGRAHEFMFGYSDGPHTDRYNENGHVDHTEYDNYSDN